MPDMINGWSHKLKLTGPVPVSFDDVITDTVIEKLSQKPVPGFTLVYLGPRPKDSFDLHNQFKGQYPNRA